MKTGARQKEVEEEQAKVEQPETSREPRWLEAPMTDYQVGVINGALAGLALGLGAAALMAWRHRKKGRRRNRGRQRRDACPTAVL